MEDSNVERLMRVHTHTHTHRKWGFDQHMSRQRKVKGGCMYAHDNIICFYYLADASTVAYFVNQKAQDYPAVFTSHRLMLP